MSVAVTGLSLVGLIRELVEIKIENNKVTEFLDANREVLYRYHCGIRY